MRQLLLAGEHYETGRIRLVIFDPGGQYLQAVEFGRHGRCERELGRIIPVAHFARRTCGIAGNHRGQPVLADDLAALAQRMDVAMHFGGFGDAAARQPEQVEADPQVVLADNVQIGLGEQDVDIGNAAGNGILDRNHCQLGLAVFHHGEGIFEAGARNGFHLGETLHAGHVRVGAGLALVGNLLAH